MKKKPYLKYGEILIIFSMLTFIFLNMGCKKDVEPIPFLFETFTINGTVINAITKEPVPNANVYCLGKVTNADANGLFYFTWQNQIPEEEVVLVSSIKKGYSTGKAYFNLGNTCITNVRMVPLNPPVNIGPEGGEIELTTDEGMGGSDKIKISFPENSVSSTISVSATQLKGIQIPGFPSYINTGHHNASTIHFEPAGFTFNKDIEVGFVLPMRMDPGVKIPLMKYNIALSVWELTSKNAIVDATGLVAKGYLNSLATYSVGISGDYEEELHSIEIKSSKKYYKNDSIIQPPDTIFCTQDSIIYPNGIPDSISVTWIYNATANNTMLLGNLVLDEEC